MPATFTHFVFVDFENVKEVALEVIEGKPVQVMLLLGKHQKKLDLALVQEILRYREQVKLVEVGASGHNALDLTLAYYLGRAVELNPGAQFSIVSKDKDFEPMIGHMLAERVNVGRHDSFAAVFRVPAAKPAPAKGAAAPRKPPRDRFAELAASFKEKPQHSPKKKATLLHHIATFYGNKLTDLEVAGVVAQLELRGALSIDDKGKVQYP